MLNILTEVEEEVSAVACSKTVSVMNTSSDSKFAQNFVINLRDRKITVELDWSTIKQLRTELIDLGRDPDKELGNYINEILKNHLNRPFFAPTLYTEIKKEEERVKGRRYVRYYIEVPPSIVEEYGLENIKVKVWIGPTGREAKKDK